MADIYNRDHLARLDRSNCTLPSSSSSDCSPGKETISIDINLPDQHKNLDTQAHGEVSLPTLLKACWILTLQCFIVADVICFKYSGPLDRGKDSRVKPETAQLGSKSCPVLYFTRLDPTETIWLFLQRLERSSHNASISANGFGIGIVDERSPQHHCNTGISISEIPSNAYASDQVSHVPRRKLALPIMAGLGGCSTGGQTCIVFKVDPPSVQPIPHQCQYGHEHIAYIHANILTGRHFLKLHDST